MATRTRYVDAELTSREIDALVICVDEATGHGDEQHRPDEQYAQRAVAKLLAARARQNGGR